MIKATLVLAAAHLVIPRLRRRSAAERHALWAASLGSAVMLPLLALLIPSWEPDWAQRAADALPAAFGTFEPSVVSSGDIVVRATGIEAGGRTLRSIIPVVWMLGSGIALLLLAVQAMRLKRLVSAAQVIDAPRVAAIAQRVADGLGLTSTPAVFASRRVAVPIAWGIRRPHILLPDSWRDWSDERVWAVLAHEMAHVARGDWLVHVVAELSCAVYWFHPLLWLTRNALGRDSERAADDAVIRLGADEADYASHLLAIVRAAGRAAAAGADAAGADAGPMPTVAMARGSHLEQRVTALLSAIVNRTGMTRGRRVAIAATAVVVACPLAALGARGAAMTIDIRTSNLPPLVAAPASFEVNTDSEPVRRIRVLDATRDSSAPAILEYTTPPLYSEEARRGAIEGLIVARARIDADGRVSQARIVKGLGFGLDQNALVALRQWRVRPGTRGDVAAPMEVELDIEFTLRNDAINALIANDMVALVGPGVTAPQALKVTGVRAPRVGRSGIVVLDVILLEDGTPRIVRILQSLGSGIDDIAIRTFEQWRFSPALKDGYPIKVRMKAEVSFHG
jgi:TonB family protein